MFASKLGASAPRVCASTGANWTRRALACPRCGVGERARRGAPAIARPHALDARTPCLLAEMPQRELCVP
eukprot:15472138-Alexandrium_andersonii.AAC.1